MNIFVKIPPQVTIYRILNKNKNALKTEKHLYTVNKPELELLQVYEVHLLFP